MEELVRTVIEGSEGSSAGITLKEMGDLLDTVEQEAETVPITKNDEWKFLDETPAKDDWDSGAAEKHEDGETDSCDSGYDSYEESKAGEGGNDCGAEDLEIRQTNSWDSGYGSYEELTAEGGWDSHGAEDFDTRGTDSNDSGYGSDDKTEDPHAIRYSQLPFRTKHYFLTYVQRILEDTCLRYARQHLSAHLSDPEWKRRNVPTASNEFQPDALVFKDWLAEDQIELESWMYFFAQTHLPPFPKKKQILESVMDLRNVAVHRGIYQDEKRELEFEALLFAMKLPTLLGDSTFEAQIVNAFKYIVEDPILDEDTRASVESEMYTPPPCTSPYKLLDRVQTLLEETCFNNAARRIPHILIQKGWDMPEQVELGKWNDVFWNAGIQHDDSANDIFPNIDDHRLSNLLIGARIHIRNVVAHRSLISDEDLIKQIHRARDICILQGDRKQAVKIELLFETYLSKKPRDQV